MYKLEDNKKIESKLRKFADSLIGTSENIADAFRKEFPDIDYYTCPIEYLQIIDNIISVCSVCGIIIETDYANDIDGEIICHDCLHEEI